jgi:TldD protein
MSLTRRNFLKAGAAVAATTGVAFVPRPLLAQLGGPQAEPLPPINDPRLAALAARALDAARRAGASYADARLGHTWTRGLSPTGVGDYELMTVGVRALVDGYWGFASGPVWSPDEMARLGAEAVHQAKANTLGRSRTVDLAPTPVVQNAHWTMPVKIEPFDVPIFEIVDYLRSLELFMGRIRGVVPNLNCQLVREDRAFAATTGSYCTQRTYQTSGAATFRLTTPDGKTGDGWLDTLTPAGLGWELFTDQPLRELITRTVAELREVLALPVKPVDVGRYDTVFDAFGVASLLHETLAPATEIDRAMGYEANADGTSYITDPLAMVGTYQAGAPALTVTGNRTEAGGVATVQWDAEGVPAEDFVLVKDGVLADFQTTRESAGWLKDYYGTARKPFRSHGCAGATSALFAPTQLRPNLAIAAGRDTHDFDALVAGMSRGLAVTGAGLNMDFQHLTGLATGRVFEVKNGKRVALINGAGLLLRSPELWRALAALGGADSTRRFGLSAKKGEPEQEPFASVTAVPARFTQLTLIDALRKA